VGSRLSFRTTITDVLGETVVDDGRPSSSPYPTEWLPQAGDLVGGHYRLVRLIGKGMFGRVFVAERIDVPAHQVALKVVPREVYSGRNVERELVMLAAASHPNIVQLKDHGTTEHYVWLTMPVYEGETLAERLKRGVLSLREAYDIFLPIARALDALHKAGLRHQDIKPENIFLATFGGRIHPILLDLGVAAERDARFVAGTILYASPEQLASFYHVSEPQQLSDKMDTYCLAATLLASLVGPEMYPGEGAESHAQMAIAQVERSDHPLCDDAIPEAFGPAREQMSAAFRRWLDPAPALRPSAGAMADELEILLEPARARERAAARSVARQRLLRRLALAGVLVLAAVGGVYAYSKRELLRLAGELGRARAEGAASFDKLDTCVASHQLAKREAAACRDERAHEQQGYRAALEHLARNDERTAFAAALTQKLRVCEDLAGHADASVRASGDRFLECDRREKEMASDLDRCRAEMAVHRAAAASAPTVIALPPVVPPAPLSPPPPLPPAPLSPPPPLPP
jgi:eukaryotic-like serine/threonine-protein kinase